jgi:hypothetical protein
MNILQMPYDTRIRMHVLLVIDAQPVWSSTNDVTLLERQQQVIRWSMHHGCPIIFEEYRQSKNEPTERNTHECLIKLPRNSEYDRYKVVRKNSENGSAQAILTCKEYGYPTNNFLIMGGEAECCIIRTVRGISIMRSNASINVIQNACSVGDPKNADEIWHKFTTIKNVHLSLLQSEPGDSQ